MKEVIVTLVVGYLIKSIFFGGIQLPQLPFNPPPLHDGEEQRFDHDPKPPLHEPLLILDTPVISTASASGSHEIRVVWNRVNNANGYKVQYGTKATFPPDGSTVEVDWTGTWVDIRSLNANTTYHVRVMATGTGNFSNSDYSAIRSATTPPLLSTEQQHTTGNTNKLPSQNLGVRIGRVYPNTTATRLTNSATGRRAIPETGDRLVSINGQEVRAMWDATRIISGLPRNSNVSIEIIDRRTSQRMTLHGRLDVSPSRRFGVDLVP
ncbi:MAG: hypothetical protein FWE95_03870 [Planctomycetaceae bacterium]|nr:hypothetical protein [Planctomycetaceae bacterium]